MIGPWSKSLHELYDIRVTKVCHCLTIGYYAVMLWEVNFWSSSSMLQLLPSYRTKFLFVQLKRIHSRFECANPRCIKGFSVPQMHPILNVRAR